jgi:hypothetical protein
LRSGNHWFVVTADETHARRLVDWQWGFAILPTRLARNEFSLVKERVINGRSLEGIRYVLARTPEQSIVATAWVDPTTGLVMRLQRDVMSGQQVLERDWADYRYQRTP